MGGHEVYFYGFLWLLIGGMEDRVILDVKNDVFYPNEGSRMGVLGGR